MTKALLADAKVYTTSPDTIEVKLYFVDSNISWTTNADLIKIKEVRFRVVGKSMGVNRWRPHLIQCKDVLPVQDKKTFNIMLKALQEAIAKAIQCECAIVTEDLLDNISGDFNDYY
jgi:hypothetical protein